MAIAGALVVVMILVLIAAGREGLERSGRNSEVTDPSAGGGGGEPIAARLVRVIDGDTIVVSLAGEQESVRYIGVDTPETAKPGQPPECYADEATELNRDLLDDGPIRLRFDRERRGPYGRLLAYVYAGRTLLNAELVRRGAARTMTIEPNTAKAALLARLEAGAGRNARGLWSACGT